MIERGWGEEREGENEGGRREKGERGREGVSYLDLKAYRVTM